jgi:uncharacterized RDD family membrane protein YckC
MNPSDVQSETEPTYFDPEEIDMSEQQFAASLEISADKPQFEIDEAEGHCEETRQISVSADEAVEYLGAGALEEHVWLARGTEKPGYPEAVAVNSAQPAEPPLDWRNLVSAKVNSYKARKPQKDHYPSLKLQFDPPAQRAIREREPAVTFDSVQQQVSELPELAPTVQIEQPEPPPPERYPRIVMEATARVIEFPRPAVFPRGDELADPVWDVPRIMEAPELLPEPPAMGGILMASPQEPEPERRPGFDVPLRSAPLRRRIIAALFDAGLVAVAVVLFGYVVFRINGTMPPLRSAATLVAGLLAVLWPAYQYAFLVFCGRTPGLRVAKLRLSRFDGEPVSRRLRRWRVLASVLSLASLGLGYGWCFLDEDQLSWHDRITKTHLAPK